jgi:hypothetical protein
MEENCLSVQQSGISQSSELMPDSEKTVHLRVELSDLIEFPTSELLKTDLTARDRVILYLVILNSKAIFLSLCLFVCVRMGGYGVGGLAGASFVLCLSLSLCVFLALVRV